MGRPVAPSLPAAALNAGERALCAGLLACPSKRARAARARAPTKMASYNYAVTVRWLARQVLLVTRARLVGGAPLAVELLGQFPAGA